MVTFEGKIGNLVSQLDFGLQKSLFFDLRSGRLSGSRIFSKILLFECTKTCHVINLYIFKMVSKKLKHVVAVSVVGVCGHF